MPTTHSERERGLLNKINSALKKIEQGTFGECEQCGLCFHDHPFVVAHAFAGSKVQQHAGCEQAS